MTSHERNAEHAKMRQLQDQFQSELNAQVHEDGTFKDSKANLERVKSMLKEFERQFMACLPYNIFVSRYDVSDKTESERLKKEFEPFNFTIHHRERELMYTIAGKEYWPLPRGSELSWLPGSRLFAIAREIVVGRLIHALGLDSKGRPDHEPPQFLCVDESWNMKIKSDILELQGREYHWLTQHTAWISLDRIVLIKYLAGLTRLEAYVGDFIEEVRAEVANCPVSRTDERLMGCTKLISNEEDGSEGVCNICGDSYNGNEVPRRLLCGHVFGTDCLLDWYHTDQRMAVCCPYCRTPLVKLSLYTVPSIAGPMEELERILSEIKASNKSTDDQMLLLLKEVPGRDHCFDPTLGTYLTELAKLRADLEQAIEPVYCAVVQYTGNRLRKICDPLFDRIEAFSWLCWR